MSARKPRRQQIGDQARQQHEAQYRGPVQTHPFRHFVQIVAQHQRPDALPAQGNGMGNRDVIGAKTEAVGAGGGAGGVNAFSHELCQHGAVAADDAGNLDMRSGAQRAQGVGGRFRIVECQRRRAVIGDDAGQRVQIALQIPAEQDQIGGHDAGAAQQQGGGGHQHDDDRQLLLNGDVAEGAHFICREPPRPTAPRPAAWN